MKKTKNYEDVKKEIERTLLRFETINNDYQRDKSGIQTILVVDTCDLIYYLHTDSSLGWNDLTTKQRITKNYFQNEPYVLVMLPYHAYEFMRYFFDILENLYSVSSGEKSVTDYIESKPFIKEFLTYYNRGEYEKALKIWKSELWNDVILLALRKKQRTKDIIEKPLSRFRDLVKTNRLRTISDLLDVKVDPSFVDNYTYNAVLTNLRMDSTRTDMDDNNDIDALTAGLSKGLNDLQDEYYFSLSTLARAPLAAYSRTIGDEKTMFCRNTSVSSYKLNITQLFHDVDARSQYVQDSIKEIKSLLERFGSLESVPLMKENSKIYDFSLSGITSARIMSSVGLMAEFYYDIYNKVISTIKSRVEQPSYTEDIAYFAEVITDEDAIIDGFKYAIRQIVDDIQEFSERLKKYTFDQSGLRIRGLDVRTEVSKIMKKIEYIGEKEG